MGIIVGLIKLLSNTPNGNASNPRTPETAAVGSALIPPAESPRVVTSETIGSGNGLRPRGYVSATNAPFAPGTALPPPSASPGAGSVAAMPWDFSPPAPGQKERELEDLRRRQETIAKIREMNGVAPRQAPPQTLEEPPEEMIEFTAGAWDLAEELGLDPDWIVDSVKPSGKRGDILVKDVKRAASIKDAAERATRQVAPEAKTSEPPRQGAAPPAHEQERPKDDAAMLEDLLKQSLEEVSGHVTTIEPD